MFDHRVRVSGVGGVPWIFNPRGSPVAPVPAFYELARHRLVCQWEIKRHGLTPAGQVAAFHALRVDGLGQVAL